MSNTERRAGSRSIARERALQALYQVDIAEADPLEALRTAWAADGASADPKGIDFAESLVKGVLAEKAALDESIGAHSHSWKVERMPRIDRNILRLGAYELTRPEPLPVNIVINEAVELAKRYGSEESRAFINGILDRMAADIRERQGDK